jgi:ParG
MGMHKSSKTMKSDRIHPGLEVSGMKEEGLKRLNINLEVSLHDSFKAATAARGETMTVVLLQFIQDYVGKNGLAPKKKARRS